MNEAKEKTNEPKLKQHLTYITKFGWVLLLFSVIL